MTKSRMLLVCALTLGVAAWVYAATRTDAVVAESEDTCHLSGPLARRLMAVGKETERDAEFYLVSLGQVRREGQRTFLVLKDKYAPGLVSLGDFSHVMVFYWFDRNDSPDKRAFIQGYRRGKKDPLTGVFATRSAVRPNLIAITTCRILSVKGNIVEIDGIDAFNDTPVLDLKPYIPRNDSFPQAETPPWVG